MQCKRVTQYDLTGRPIAQFPSLHQASKSTSINCSMIRKCCLGISSSTRGFIFLYSLPSRYTPSLEDHLTKIKSLSTPSLPPTTPPSLSPPPTPPTPRVLHHEPLPHQYSSEIDYNEALSLWLISPHNPLTKSNTLDKGTLS